MGRLGAAQDRSKMVVNTLGLNHIPFNLLHPLKGMHQLGIVGSQSLTNHGQVLAERTIYGLLHLCAPGRLLHKLLRPAQQADAIDARASGTEQLTVATLTVATREPSEHPRNGCVSHQAACTLSLSETCKVQVRTCQTRQVESSKEHCMHLASTAHLSSASGPSVRGDAAGAARGDAAGAAKGDAACAARGTPACAAGASFGGSLQQQDRTCCMVKALAGRAPGDTAHLAASPWEGLRDTRCFFLLPPELPASRLQEVKALFAYDAAPTAGQNR